jgi:hypothetical protein
MHIFKSPFTAIVVGATSSGKSQWTKKLIENSQQMIDPAPAYILYCYGEVNPLIIEYKQKGIEIFNGIPDAELIKSLPKPLLLIIDDLMLDIEPHFLDLLFTRGSHNWNCSVIFITQSLYGKNIRTARANTHYLVLMRNPSSMSSIHVLASQMYPGQTKFFLEAFHDATAEPYGYMLIDSHPNTKNNERLMTKIWPNEQTIYYLPI